jgi:Uma2 family endonuclease
MATSPMLTREDLDALPDDGLRHELIDGTFVMTPSPGMAHQDFLFALAVTLHNTLMGSGLKVVQAPYDVILGTNVVKPDILVAPRAAFTERCLATAPLLVVEIQSASTGWLDEGRKLSLYEQAGVAHYWLADPRRPSVTILQLVDGRYQQVGMVEGDDELTVSAPVRIGLRPSDLAKG